MTTQELAQKILEIIEKNEQSDERALPKLIALREEIKQLCQEDIVNFTDLVSITNEEWREVSRAFTRLRRVVSAYPERNRIDTLRLAQEMDKANNDPTTQEP